MPLNSISSFSHTRFPEMMRIDNSNIQKSKIIENIKMVYGFHEDISNFKKAGNNFIALDDLNLISGINAESILNSPGVFIQNILLGNVKTDNYSLNKYSNDLSLNADSLRKTSEK